MAGNPPSMARAPLLRLDHQPGALVVTLECDITPENEEAFAQEMEAAAGEPATAFVVDLSRVQFISSSALGALIQLQTAIKRQGGLLALVGATERVRRMFRVTGIDRLIPLATSIEGALTRLLGEGEPKG